jgi:hypothetical protein
MGWTIFWLAAVVVAYFVRLKIDSRAEDLALSRPPQSVGQWS